MGMLDAQIAGAGILAMEVEMGLVRWRIRKNFYRLCYRFMVVFRSLPI